MDDPQLCQMCHQRPPADEEGLCSPCGFTVRHLHSLGFGALPTNAAGVGCETCVKADVCIAKVYADQVGAIIAGCASRVESSELKEKEPVTPARDQGKEIEIQALAKCKTACPHSGDRGELPGCKMKSFAERVSICGEIGRWARQIEC